jgi:hypothetical protein
VEKNPAKLEGEVNFTAEVKITGINPYVGVPDEVIAAWGVERRHLCW